MYIMTAWCIVYPIVIGNQTEKSIPSMRSLIALLAFIGMASAKIDINNLQQLEAAKKLPNPQTLILHNIQVPAGQALELQNLKPGTTIVFAGRITFGYKEWNGPMIIIKGKNLKVEGRPGHLIDGEGQRWWDVLGGNGGKRKPSMIYVQLEDSTVSGLKVKNSPAWCFAINDCRNLQIGNIEIDNSLGHSKGGHNTDGFDIAKSRNVRIYNSKVNNQDDCLAINSGTDIVFEGNRCEGGHGIAVAVGGYDLNEAKNITIRNCEVIKNNIGIRVKTHKQGKGIVQGVTFDNITLKDISEIGIVIIGNYLNEGPRGDPNPGIPIHNLRITHVRGNVLKNGTNSLVFVAPGSPKGWVWKADVTGGTKKRECRGVPSNIPNPC